MTKELEDSLKENKKLTCETCCNLKIENILLNEKANDLTKVVHNFTNGKKNFDLMLGKQNVFLTKEVLDTNLF